jgi:hypothetical protein
MVLNHGFLTEGWRLAEKQPHLFGCFSQRRAMSYQYLATSRTGFVRQLCQYLSSGYWFYVTGTVKPGRDPEQVDARLLAKYDVAISRQARWRRKRRGLANVHYLRHERFWILCATHGEHRFFAEHVKQDARGEIIARYFRDARRDPILFGGYSLRMAQGQYRPHRSKQNRAGPPERDDRLRVRIQINRQALRDLTAECLRLAASHRWNAATLEAKIYGLPYEPYAPVRQQLLNLVRRMNAVRRARGIQNLLVAKRAVRFRMRVVSPFVDVDFKDW